MDLHTNFGQLCLIERFLACEKKCADSLTVDKQDHSLKLIEPALATQPRNLQVQELISKFTEVIQASAAEVRNFNAREEPAFANELDLLLFKIDAIDAWVQEAITGLPEAPKSYFSYIPVIGDFFADSLPKVVATFNASIEEIKEDLAVVSGLDAKTRQFSKLRSRAPLFRQNEINTFKSSAIYQSLKGTSDHSWKTYDVEYSNGPSVKVGTWNLMDWCRKVHQDFFNNPVNATETPDDYILRKKIQTEEILNIFKEQKVDVLVLQEVDFFTQGEAISNGTVNSKIPQKNIDAYATVYATFVKRIEREGLKLMTSNPLDKNQQALITIYNPQKLNPVNPHQEFLEGCFLTDPAPNRAQKQRGGEVTFADADGKEVVISNLHLDFNMNAQEAIEDYQKGHLEAGRRTIALGDMNKHSGSSIPSAIGDWKFATNVDAIDTKRRQYKEALTCFDSNTGFKKVYDCASVSPSPDEDVLIRENDMLSFIEVCKNGVQKLKMALIKLDREHASEIGQPWKRGRA